MRKLQILKKVFALRKKFFLILFPILATSFFFLGTRMVQGTQHYPNCLHFDMTFNATGWNSSIMGNGMDIGCAGDYGPDGCRGGVQRIRPGERLELRRCTCDPYGDPRYEGRGCLVIGRDLAMEDYNAGPGITRRRVVRGPGTDLPSYCKLRVKGIEYNNTDFFPTASQYAANNAVTFCGVNGNERDKSFSVICSPSPTPTHTPTPTLSPTPPPSTHSISGGIFIDDDGDGAQESTDGNGQKDAGESFYAGPPPPQVNITGPGTNVNVDNGASGFSISNLSPGSYRITFNLPSGYNAIYPGISPYTVDVTLGQPGPTDCSILNHLYARCSGANAVDVTFAIKPPQQEKWIQSVGGDIRYDRPNWVNYVPPGTTNICPSNPTTPYVSSSSLSGPSLSGGTVFTGLNPVFTTDGSSPRSKSTPPPNQRLIRDNKFTPGRGTIKTSYAYVKSAIDRTRPPTSGFFGTACNADPSGDIRICILKPIVGGNYIGEAGRNVVLRSPTGTYDFAPNSNYIFVIDGYLYIETNLRVPRGSSVLFIVKGELHVGGGVNRIEGVFSTDRTFIIRNNATTPTPLIVEGNIIANAGLSSGAFTNERDLAAQNAQCPAVRIINRPDFILNGPAIIRYSNYIVEEVAPRGN